MAKRKTDFNFTNDGYFVSLFPNNDQAETIWAEINEHFDGKIPVTAWASVKYQIKQAGYSVRKSPKVTKAQWDAILDDDLLAELTA